MQRGKWWEMRFWEFPRLGAVNGAPKSQVLMHTNKLEAEWRVPGPPTRKLEPVLNYSKIFCGFAANATGISAHIHLFKRCSKNGPPSIYYQIGLINVRLRRALRSLSQKKYWQIGNLKVVRARKNKSFSRTKKRKRRCDWEIRDSEEFPGLCDTWRL